MDSLLNRKEIRQDQQDFYDFLPGLARKKTERLKVQKKRIKLKAESKISHRPVLAKAMPRQAHTDARGQTKVGGKELKAER